MEECEARGFVGGIGSSGGCSAKSNDGEVSFVVLLQSSFNEVEHLFGFAIAFCLSPKMWHNSTGNVDNDEKPNSN